MVAAALTLAGCDRGTSAGGTADDIRKQALALVAAYDRQDARAAAAFDAPDYVGIYHGTPNNVGPAADFKEMTAAMAISKLDWQVGEGKVTVSKAGDIGIFEAPYTFTITTGAAPPARENGTWIAIFKRQDDGAMKLWRSIASDSPAPAPGA
jgi:ketosteroid isomerase-like protein